MKKESDNDCSQQEEPTRIDDSTIDWTPHNLVPSSRCSSYEGTGATTGDSNLGCQRVAHASGSAVGDPAVSTSHDRDHHHLDCTSGDDMPPITVIADPPSSLEEDEFSCTSSITTHFHDTELFVHSLYPSLCNIREDPEEETYDDIFSDPEDGSNKQKQSTGGENLVGMKEKENISGSVLHQNATYKSVPEEKETESQTGRGKDNILGMTKLLQEANYDGLSKDQAKVNEMCQCYSGDGNELASPSSQEIKYKTDNVSRGNNNILGKPHYLQEGQSKGGAAENEIYQSSRGDSNDLAAASPLPPGIGSSLGLLVRGFAAISGIGIVQPIPRPPERIAESLPGAHPVQGTPYNIGTPRQQGNLVQQEPQSTGDSLGRNTIELQVLPEARPVSDLPVAVPEEEEEEDKDDRHGDRLGGARWKQLGSRHSRVLMTFVLSTALVAGATLVVLEKMDRWSSDPTTKAREAHINKVILDAFGQGYLDNEQKKKALHWIIFEDPQNGLASSEAEGQRTDDENLIQRFSLAAFYFQSSYQNPWPFCNPPEAGHSSLCYYIKKNPGGVSKLQTNVPSMRWLSATHECQWMGITCATGTKIITEIALTSKNLTGTLPSELSKLSRLKDLSVDYNHLSGPLPFWTPQVQTLQKIDLSYNQFTGTIHQDYFSLTNLRTFDLGSNLLTGLIPAKASALDMFVLSLSKNLLTSTIPRELYSLPNLGYILFGDNSLTGSISSHLGNLTELNQFIVGYNQDLGGSIPSEIAHLEKFERLNIEGTRVGGSIPEALWAMDGLTVLSLSRSRISGTISSKIGHLTNLGWFQIAETLISGTIPTAISKLSRLTKLHLERNSNLVGSLPKNLCSNLLNVGIGQRREIVVDCSPSSSSGVPNVVCPDRCCTSCCEAGTKICREL